MVRFGSPSHLQSCKWLGFLLGKSHSPSDPSRWLGLGCKLAKIGLAMRPCRPSSSAFGLARPTTYTRSARSEAGGS